MGETYFAVSFLDDDAPIPLLEPKVFIGRDLEEGDKDEFYFQDSVSYKNGSRFEAATRDDEAVFETGAEKHVFEYERALDVLMACAVRRRKTPSQK